MVARAAKLAVRRRSKFDTTGKIPLETHLHGNRSVFFLNDIMLHEFLKKFVRKTIVVFVWIPLSLFLRLKMSCLQHADGFCCRVKKGKIVFR